MPDTPEPYADLRQAILLSLTTAHAHLAQRNGLALRYPEPVAPFAALREPIAFAMHDLGEMLLPGETTFLLGDRPPDAPGLRWQGTVPCLQMVFPGHVALPEAPDAPQIVPLSCADAPAMEELIAASWPGYFRAETCRMGDYFGIREHGRLIAMGGERLVLRTADGTLWREISALAVRPAEAGRGLGTAVLAHVIGHQRAQGGRPWLHVTTANLRAIALYRRLGFETVREIELHRIVREASAGSAK